MFPVARLYVMEEIDNLYNVGKDTAAILEDIMYTQSGGLPRVYMTFTEDLLTSRDLVSVDALFSHCRKADDSQAQLSALNAQREAIIAEIASCKLEVADSYRKCPKCGCRKLGVDERQTRSADEETTKFYTCLREECGYRFR